MFGIEEVYEINLSKMGGIMHGVWAGNEFGRTYKQIHCIKKVWLVWVLMVRWDCCWAY